MLYHFGLAVKVIAGFYIGCSGIVTGVNATWDGPKTIVYEYSVDMSCKFDNGRIERLNAWVQEKQLKENK